MYYPQFTQVIIHYFLTQDKTLSWRNKIGVHTFNDDYLVNTLRFVSAKEETQIHGVILPESLTSPEMKETKAYKTYFGFSTGATPPKKARKFKKTASPKLTIVPVSTKEPMGKSKRIKRPAKKSTQDLARGVVIRETPEIPVSKKKENVDVARGKGIELLSQVALTEDAHAAIIKPSITNEGTGVKPGVLDVTEEESSKNKDSDDDKTQSDYDDESDSEHEKDENESDSESDQEENEEDDVDDEEEEDEEVVKTSSNDSDDEDETKIADKAEGDGDEEMDYTTSLPYDNVDIRLNEQVDTDKGFVQDEGTDATMTDIFPIRMQKIVSPMDVHVHHEVPNQQTPTLLTVPVSVVSETSPTYSTIIPQSIPSFTPSPPQSTPTPPPTTKATNPPSTLLNFALIFQFDNKATTLEKEVVELKKDPFHT
ncbi:hypothetical protein Tco_1288971 [Tanacetum coccineum]